MDVYMAMSHINLHRDKAGSSLLSEKDDIMMVIPRYRHAIMSFLGSIMGGGHVII
jgi:hypothetical protein